MAELFKSLNGQPVSLVVIMNSLCSICKRFFVWAVAYTMSRSEKFVGLNVCPFVSLNLSLSRSKNCLLNVLYTQL